MYKKIFKNIFDKIFALILFVILLPLFIIIMILLFSTTFNSPFYFQKRPGKNGHMFKIIKFKTMTDKRDHNGILFPEEKRVTQIGKFIRRFSIDEIPQLINILRGDMSLVGPRPLLPEYLNLYNNFQKRRHEVKPGITGLTQVNGRNRISWQEKFLLDIKYVDNVSFLLDIKILFKTFNKIFINKEVSPNDALVMEKFTGQN